MGLDGVGSCTSGASALESVGFEGFLTFSHRFHEETIANSEFFTGFDISASTEFHRESGHVPSSINIGHATDDMISNVLEEQYESAYL